MQAVREKRRYHRYRWCRPAEAGRTRPAQQRVLGNKRPMREAKQRWIPRRVGFDFVVQAFLCRRRLVLLPQQGAIENTIIVMLYYHFDQKCKEGFGIHYLWPNVLTFRTECGFLLCAVAGLVDLCARVSRRARRPC